MSEIIKIRTSDRILFRRCRRLWGLTSPLRHNFGLLIRPDYFWVGTGVHYALEDFHGYRRYPSAAAAFLAYVEATLKAGKAPPGISDLVELGTNMMVYYQKYWLEDEGRDPLCTYVVDGVPQVEVHFELELPIKGPQGQPVHYEGTFDRIIVDEYDRLWIVEYKTAKSFVTGHFDTDPQITAYCWAAHALYDRPIAGVIYQQHRKSYPQRPRLLSNGKVSTSKNMLTTPKIYARTLSEIYGDVEHAPPECRKYLQDLIRSSIAGEGGNDFTREDAFVRRDFVYRNEHQLATEGEKILMEVEEMIREDLPLYPNPTRECSWRCPLESVCVALDDGSDYESLLRSLTTKKPSAEEESSWRALLPHTPPEVPQNSLLLIPPKDHSSEEEEPNLDGRKAAVDPEQIFLESLGISL